MTVCVVGYGHKRACRLLNVTCSQSESEVTGRDTPVKRLLLISVLKCIETDISQSKVCYDVSQRSRGPAPVVFTPLSNGRI